MAVSYIVLEAGSKLQRVPDYNTDNPDTAKTDAKEYSVKHLTICRAVDIVKRKCICTYIEGRKVG